MGKESFLALLRHSEHSLRVKGENRVLSLTLPPFSFLQCSPSNCRKATGDRGALPYLIPPGRREPRERGGGEEGLEEARETDRQSQKRFRGRRGGDKCPDFGGGEGKGSVIFGVCRNFQNISLKLISK